MDGRQKYSKETERIRRDIHGYKFLSLLNHTMYATRYLAETREHSCLVMIELFPQILSAQQQQHFLREAARLRALEHSHILPVLAAGVERQPFLVLNYIEHRTLRQIYAARSVYDLSRLLPYLRPLAHALQYAHEKRIAHKNVRPESVLLNRDNEVLLCDFMLDALNSRGEGQHDEYVWEAGERVAYLAPEQFSRRDSYASDIYALGVMVYEWISGAPPFQGSSVDIAEQHLRMPLPPLMQEQQPVSLAIVQAVQRAMAKDPAERYRTPLAFVEALEQAQSEARKASYTFYSLMQERERQLSKKHAATAVQKGHSAAMKSLKAQKVAAKGKQTREREIEPHEDGSSPHTSVSIPSVTLPPETSPLFTHEHAASSVPSIPSVPPTLPGSMTTPPVLPVLRPVDSRSMRKTRSGQPGERPMSRRGVLLSLAGFATLAGGGAWLLSQHSMPPYVAVHKTVHRMSNGPVLSPFTTLIFRGHTKHVNALSWSPDMRFIATAGADRVVLIFQSVTGVVTRTYAGHSAEVRTVSWSPDGKLLASAGADNTVHVWEAATGRVMRIYRGHLEGVNAVAWSNDSMLVASASDDHTVHVWNVHNGEVAMIYQGHTRSVNAVAWSRDNIRIASGSGDHTVQVWATVSSSAFASGDTIFTYRGHSAEVYGVAWSPDGLSIASAGGDRIMQVCNGVNGSKTVFPPRIHDDVVYQVAWSPDGRQLATASADKAVRLWDSRDGHQTFLYREHTDRVFDVAWSPDGKRLASASADTTTRVWHT